MRQQPRTHEVLVLLLMSLAECGLTLADYPLFLNTRYRPDVAHLVRDLKNPAACAQWAILDKYRDSDFTEYVSSVARRLFTLLSNPIIGSVFSQTEGAINLRRAMDNGEVLLFDLRDTEIFDRDSAQLFGLLLISTLFAQSKLRENTNPYFLYLDEAHRFLSGSNLAEIFEECRKFGVHLALCHQNLGQLRDAGERVFSTVINEAEIKTVPYKIHTILTDNRVQLVLPPRYRKGVSMKYSGGHMFGMRCVEHSIEYRLTKIKHPRTNGQAEHMNRTIKEATVKRFHYDNHAQLRAHLADFMNAYNFARRLKTLKGLTPYEFICKSWTKEPERFTLNPIHNTMGLNTLKSHTEQAKTAGDMK